MSATLPVKLQSKTVACDPLAPAATIPSSPSPVFSGASSLSSASASPSPFAVLPSSPERAHRSEVSVSGAGEALLGDLRAAMLPALMHLDGAKLDEVFKTRAELLLKIGSEKLGGVPLVDMQLNSMLENKTNPKRFEQALLFAERATRNPFLRTVHAYSCEAYCLYHVLIQKNEHPKDGEKKEGAKRPSKEKELTSQRYEQFYELSKTLCATKGLSGEFKELWQGVVQHYQKLAKPHPVLCPKSITVEVYETCLELSEVWMHSIVAELVGISQKTAFITMLQKQHPKKESS